MIAIRLDQNIETTLIKHCWEDQFRLKSNCIFSVYFYMMFIFFSSRRWFRYWWWSLNRFRFLQKKIACILKYTEKEINSLFLKRGAHKRKIHIKIEKMCHSERSHSLNTSLVIKKWSYLLSICERCILENLIVKISYSWLKQK